MDEKGSATIRDFKITVFNEKYADAADSEDIYLTCSDMKNDIHGITQDFTYKYKSDFYNGDISIDEVKLDIEILKQSIPVIDKIHDLAVDLLTVNKELFYNLYLLLSNICREYNKGTLVILDVLHTLN
jgi:hypothetical protein